MRLFRDLTVAVTRWANETVVIYLAIAYLPIMIGIGAAIDYSRASHYKAALQAALDAAVLSGGRAGTKDWIQIARKEFNANLSSTYGTVPKPSFVLDPSTGYYVGKLTDARPTSVLQILNIGSISVSVQAAAVAADDHAFILARDDDRSRPHAWRIGRSTGDVSVTNSAGQRQAAGIDGTILEAGNKLRTGKDGRALLVRGEDTMLIAPNSILGIPTDKTEGLATTIHQWAGSILLAVARKGERHFDVVTPYLAAAVVGTQFRVTVGKTDASVDVLRGQVEVQDFKSGEYALVLPGQVARASTQGPPGLSLSGSGRFDRIQQGMPRDSSVHPFDLHAGDRSMPGAASLPHVGGPATGGYSTDISQRSGSGLFTWLFSNPDSQRDRKNDIALIIAFALGIGILVAFVVSTLRHG